MAFSLIKPLLSEKTLNKFSLLGQDPDIWKAALLAEIPAELLPVSYGGTLTDPLDGNPDCSSLVIFPPLLVFLKFGLIRVFQVNMGGLVPSCYYLKNRQTKSIESNESGTLVVDSRSKKFLEIRVKNANTIIE